MLECKSFKKYDAKRPPTCNGGKGCEACRRKYDGVARAKARRTERMRKSSR